jgi:hypothetical protein
MDETTSPRVHCFSTEKSTFRKIRKIFMCKLYSQIYRRICINKIRKINGLRTVNVTVIWSVMQCHVVDSTVEELNASVFGVEDNYSNFLK